MHIIINEFWGETGYTDIIFLYQEVNMLEHSILKPELSTLNLFLWVLFTSLNKVIIDINNSKHCHHII